MRCCSSENGAGRRPRAVRAGSSCQTMISPSSTVPSGRACASASISGKALGDQLFAARPDPDLAGALDHLAADAVVLPFHQPVGRPGRAATRTPRAARPAGAPGRRDRAGPGPAAPAPPSCCAISAWKRSARGHDLAVGVAHHALRHPLGVDAGMRGQRALHQQLADADPEAAADQLGQQEAALRVELVASTTSMRGATCSARLRPRSGSSRSSTQSARPTSLGSLVAAAAPARWSRPGRPPPGSTRRTASRRCRRPRRPAARSSASRHHLPRLAAGQEVHRPGRVGGRRLREVALQRLDLGVGRGGGVELGEQVREALHGVAARLPRPPPPRRRRTRSRTPRPAGPARPASAPSPARCRA